MLLYLIKRPDLLITSDILRPNCYIFRYESIDACNFLHTPHLHYNFPFFALSKFEYRKKTYVTQFLPSLSGDISLYPGHTEV